MTATNRRLSTPLMLGLATTVFLPIFWIGFTTQDDARDSLIRFGDREAILSASTNTGRFSVLWTAYIAQLPYLIDSQIWQFVTKLGGFLVLCLAIFWTSKVIFGSLEFALLNVTLFLIFIQNGWQHNLLTSYPLVFNVFASCFVVSLGLFVHSIKTDSLAKRNLAAIIYFFSLATETFVPMITLFFFISLSLTSLTQSGIKKSLVSAIRLTFPIGISLTVYLVLSIVWRFTRDVSYEGAQLTSISMSSAVKPAFLLGINSLPLQSMAMLDRNLSYLFRDSPMWISLTILYATIGSVLVFGLLNLITKKQRQVAFSPTSLTISVSAMFLVLIPVAVISKYQDWIDAGVRTVHYTLFSTIFAATSVGILITGSIGLTNSTRLRQFLLVIVGVGVFAVCAVVQVNNYYYFQDQTRSGRKWQLVEEMLKSPLFLQMPENSRVIAPSLINDQRGIAKADEAYWEDFIESKSGKNVNLVEGYCKSDSSCYYVEFVQDRFQDDQYIILTQMVDPSALTAREFELIAIPGTGGRYLSGEFLGRSATRKRVLLNNKVARGVILDTEFSLHLPCESLSLTSVSVKSSSPIKISTLSIGIGKTPKYLQGFGISLLSGDYQSEDDGCETWQWFRKSATLELYSNSGFEQAVILSGEVNSIHPNDNVSIWNSTDGLTGFSTSSAEWTNFELAVTLRPGSNLIWIFGENDEVRADTRYLSFRLRNLSVAAKSPN